MRIQPAPSVFHSRWKTKRERALQKIAENCQKKFNLPKTSAKDMAQKIYNSNNRLA